MQSRGRQDAAGAAPSDDEPGTAARQACQNVPLRQRRRRPGVGMKQSLSAFQHLPEYLRDNEYITKYYRVDYGTRDTLKSLFSVHNETGNIWSHLLGFLLFAILTAATLYARPAMVQLSSDAYHKLVSAEQHVEGLLAEVGKDGLRALRGFEGRLLERGDATLQELWAMESRLLHYGAEGLRGLEDRLSMALASVLDVHWPVRRWPVYVFTAGAMVCMLTSAACHLFGCCSRHLAQLVWRFDYAGIVVLIVTSFVPPVYYGFLCQPLIRNFYLASTTLLGLVTAWVSLAPSFQDVRFRAFRAGLFATLGLWGIVPALHGWLAFGAATPVHRAFVHDVTMGAVYLLGAAFYALRIPERWKPGAFDLAFNSHQLFHVCVVAAAAVHYRGIRILLDWRDITGGCALL